MPDEGASRCFVHMQEGGGIPLLGEMSSVWRIPFRVPLDSAGVWGQPSQAYGVTCVPPGWLAENGMIYYGRLGIYLEST